MADRDPSVRRAAWILSAIAAIEGVWVVFTFAVNGAKFWRYLGFYREGSGNPGGWIVGAVVTAAFVVVGMRLASVRSNLFRPSFLKLLAVLVAISAGIFEEVFFRKLLMDAIQARGYGVSPQVAASALAFGIVHGIWGFFGRSLRAAIGATLATGVLGAGLAMVYAAGGRSLLPCVVSHVVLNLLLEPGLVLAAARGEMSRKDD
jgi:CAAX protease family protein